MKAEGKKWYHLFGKELIWQAADIIEVMEAQRHCKRLGFRVEGHRDAPEVCFAQPCISTLQGCLGRWSSCLKEVLYFKCFEM